MIGGEDTIESVAKYARKETQSSTSASGPVWREFTKEEQERIQNHLDRPLEAEHIQFRPAAQGSVAYIEGWKVLSIANEVFGFNGWSSEILSLSCDFVDVGEGGKISLGISCMDIGYGSAENQRSKAAAYEKARKEAVTDAMKRCMRIFGTRLGNCAYDKAYLRHVKSGSKRPYQSGTGADAHHQAPIPPPPQQSRPMPPPPVAQQFNAHPAPLAPVSEADSELIVTEERKLLCLSVLISVELLEFGSFLADSRAEIHEMDHRNHAHQPVGPTAASSSANASNKVRPNTVNASVRPSHAAAHRSPMASRGEFRNIAPMGPLVPSPFPLPDSSNRPPNGPASHHTTK